MSSRIPDKWYKVRHLGDDVSLITETWIADWLRCNIWHVRGSTHDLLVDSGMGMRPLKAEVASLTERPVICVSSHCHFDHVGGAHEFDCRLGHQSEADVHASPDIADTVTSPFIRAETFRALPHAGFHHSEFRVTPAPLTGYLDEGDVVDLGNRTFKVLHLPGHSPGSIALWEESTGIFFTGDVVYDGGLLDNLYHSDKSLYRESLQRLHDWPVKVVHGGHGDSFGKDRMNQIIDDYMAGRGVMSDPDAYIEQEIARSKL